MSELPTAVKLAGFAAGLAAVFGATIFLGDRVGPVDDTTAADHGSTHEGEPATDPEVEAGHGDEHESTDPSEGAAAVADVPGGLQVSSGGYTFVLDQTAVAPGEQTISFQIVGPDAEPVTAYDVAHEKELHLIAVRRDFTDFQHVHPERADDGTWSVPINLTGGSWRLFADFVPTPAEGQEPAPLTLGADLLVTGPSELVPDDGPEEVRVDTVDGYQVELTGSMVVGGDNNLTFTVTRDGDPIADLQPYLGARGHLVALREGDLAYLHVHPTDAADATGNTVGFGASVPSAGGYRLYLDFRVDDVVRTASFALPAAPAGTPETSTTDETDTAPDEPVESDAPAEEDHSGH